MPDFIPFYTRIWSDKRFKKPYLKDNDARIVCIFLFGNSEITLTGIYELDLENCRMRCDTSRDFDEVFTEVVSNGMFKWDKENQILFVVNRFKIIPNNCSSQIIKGTWKELDRISHPFKDEFISKYHTIIGDNRTFRLATNREGNITEQNLQDFLNEKQITSFINYYHWDKRRIKEFYANKGIAEQRIDTILQEHFSYLK